MRRYALRLTLALATFFAGCGDGTVPEDAGPDVTLDATPDAPMQTSCERDSDCDDGLYCTGSESCNPASPDADARGCVAGDAPCGADEECDEMRERCSAMDCSMGGDGDGDGDPAPACGGRDCDDDDARRHSSGIEACDPDGVDEDCDETTIQSSSASDGDRDGDGFISVACFNAREDGDENRGTDCDDTQPTVYPGAVEQCNAIDDDCDGVVDEGMVATVCRRDADGDGFAPMGAESRTACGGCPDDFVEWTAGDAVDCRDDDPSVSPGSPEICNMIDDDCDGSVDEEATNIGSTDHCRSCFDGCQFACGASGCDLPADLVVTGQAICTRTDEGRLYCWGSNGGAVGDGAVAARDRPYEHTLGARVRQIAGSDPGTICAEALGQFYCWGRNSSGELGDGTMTNRSLPTPITLAASGTSRDMGMATSNTCVIDEGYVDPVLCWGTTVHFQDVAGSWQATSSSSPRHMSGMPAPVKIVPNFWGGCVLLPDDTVQCWGHEDMAGRGGNPSDWRWIEPGTVALPGAVSDLAGAYRATCAIVGGEVWCWGFDDHGQLGDGPGGVETCSGMPCARSPRRVGSLSDISQLWVGPAGACARNSSNETYCWGENLRRPDGNMSQFPGLPEGLIESPMRAPMLDRFEVLEFGGRVVPYGCGVDTGIVYCWGANDRGVGSAATVGYGIQPVLSP